MNQLVCIPILTLSLMIIYNHINDRIRRLENECHRYKMEEDNEKEKKKLSGELLKQQIVVDNNRLIRIEVSIYNEILGIRDV